MRSRASFCNAALYRKDLTRFAPLWIAYLALLLVLFPLSILSQAQVFYDFTAADLLERTLQTALNAGCILNLVYACAVAMCFHGWMYRGRSVNALAALPVRRETVFATHLLSALTVGLLPNLLTALLTWGAAAVLGLPGFPAAAQWLGVMCLQFLFFYGLAALCAMLVGQLLALPGLYVLANFTAVVVNYVVVRILESFVYGLPGNDGMELLAPLSPAYYILQGLDRHGASLVYTNSAYLPWESWRYLLIVAAVGVGLLAAAFLLYRRRPMERAGSLTVFRPLRPVLKYCFTAGCALVLGVLAADVFFNGSGAPALWVLVLCMLAGGFVGYFTAEILLQKSFRVFRREWIGFGVFAAVLLLCVGLMETDAFGYERRVPDAVEVESVTLDGYGVGGTVTDAAHIADLITLHQSLIDERDAQEVLARKWSSGGSEPIDYTWVELSYRLRDGGTLSRSYRIFCTDRMWLDSASLPRRYAQLAQDPYYIRMHYAPGFPVGPEDMSFSEVGYYDLELETWRYETLSSEDAWALYAECVYPDIQEGRLGYRAPFFFENLSDIRYAADLSLSFEKTADVSEGLEPERVVLDSWYIQVDPTVGSRTAERLEALGFSLCLESQQAEAETAKASADVPVG